MVTGYRHRLASTPHTHLLPPDIKQQLTRRPIGRGVSASHRWIALGEPHVVGKRQ